MKTSEIHGFYKKSREERLKIVKEFAGLDDGEIGLLKQHAAMDFGTADGMVENVFSTQQLPLGIATNFMVNGKDVLVPMSVEEPSVVAAASHAAKLARESEGFKAETDEPVMIGQVQLVGIEDMKKAENEIMGKKQGIIESANACDPTLVKFGGGARDLQFRKLDNNMAVVHLLVDVRDAMGANAVNTMCEAIAPELEKLSGGRKMAKIISNLAIHRKARAEAVWKRDVLEESLKGKGVEMKGEEIVDAILDVYRFAVLDQFRATTHNKGIMNGIDAVALATGQDWRAIEAGAHSYAAYGGKYKPLTSYSKDKDGNLVGKIELPIAVGLVGGAVKTSPIAGICIKILGVKTSRELAGIMAAAGLAQNFAAIREIATRGIQAGHMQLHAKNIAVMAGAKGKQIVEIAEKMIKEKNIRIDRAKELIGGKE